MMFVPSRDLGPGAVLGATKPLLSAQWMAAAGTLFPAFPASSQHSVQCTTHNADWRQIVGTEQKKDKLLFFAFNAYSASCNVSALELGTLVLFISFHQFDI